MHALYHIARERLGWDLRRWMVLVAANLLRGRWNLHHARPSTRIEVHPAAGRVVEVDFGRWTLDIMITRRGSSQALDVRRRAPAPSPTLH